LEENMKFKKLLSVTLVSALACAALASCTSLVADKGANIGELTYIGLRINPEIEMVADENGTIVSANAVNEDGEVVLSTVELEGKTIEDATEAFTETAVDLGFMDPEAGKDTVYVDVNGESAEATEKVEKKINDKLVKFFEKKGISGKVSKEVLDTYLATAEEWNVTPGHAKIIARVLTANPELTYDELLNLTVKDLLELLKTGEKIAVDCKGDYKAKVEALKEEYKELFVLREEIDDIEDKLEDAREEDDDDDDDDDDDKLTAEEIAALEAELAEKKAKADQLKKEFDEKLAAIKAEFKVTSEEARKEHRKEADERKQAIKDGKHFEDRDDDDDDDDEDDDNKHDGKGDRDEKPADKNEKPADKNEKPAKPEHDDDDAEEADDDDDDDDDDHDGKKHQNKGDKAPVADAPAADAPVVDAPTNEEIAA
jgi:hypothetical protein